MTVPLAAWRDYFNLIVKEKASFFGWIERVILFAIYFLWFHIIFTDRG